MNEINRKPAYTVTELASARQHQKTGRPFLLLLYCTIKKRPRRAFGKRPPAPALPIEQSTPGFANSRVRALPHVHPRGLGSRPSSLRGLNKEFYEKKLKTKKLRHLED